MEMREAFDSRRRLMHRLVSAIPGFECVEPQGAFYVFPNVEAALGDRFGSSAELAEVIIDRAGVALVPGESFGTPGYLRLSYALGEDDIRRGVGAIGDLIESG